MALCGLCISVLLFVACLLLPAYTVEGPEGPRTVFGILELAIGWLGIFHGLGEWLANPLLLVAWGLMLVRRYKAAMITALGAALVASGFLLREMMVVSEAPTYGRILAYHWGYWLWVGSAVVACMASAAALRETSNIQDL